MRDSSRPSQRLAGFGWEVRVEVSFNHFGDRGRIDLIAYDAPRGILLVVEIKSALGDLQETLGRLDVKVRLGRQIAHELGWTEIATVIPTLVVGESARTANDRGPRRAIRSLRAPRSRGARVAASPFETDAKRTPLVREPSRFTPGDHWARTSGAQGTRFTPAVNTDV